MKLEVLVSAVDKNAAELIPQMNIVTDAVLVNQCDSYGYETLVVQSGRVKCFSMPERGVGLSRNTALLHASGDVTLFSDEDIILASGYAEKIRRAYESLPDADMILFNVEVAASRRTYWNREIRRITYRNYGRYPAYSISAKLDALRRANVHYSLLFGGGAKYSNGEDSLFLKDCLKYGLVVYAVPIEIGEERERESTWFQGYNDKFFIDRGVLYHFLYGGLAYLMSVRFLLVHGKVMCTKIPMKNALALMKKGIKSVEGL